MAQWPDRLLHPLHSHCNALATICVLLKKINVFVSEHSSSVTSYSAFEKYLLDHSTVLTTACTVCRCQLCRCGYNSLQNSLQLWLDVCMETFRHDHGLTSTKGTKLNLQFRKSQENQQRKSNLPFPVLVSVNGLRSLLVYSFGSISAIFCRNCSSVSCEWGDFSRIFQNKKNWKVMKKIYSYLHELQMVANLHWKFDRKVLYQQNSSKFFDLGKAMMGTTCSIYQRVQFSIGNQLYDCTFCWWSPFSECIWWLSDDS